MKAPLAVTLIHGTWGRDAPFTRSGSPLRQAITDLLEPRNGFSNKDFLRIAFLEFNWRGANGNHSRWTASTELAKFLRKAIGTYPDHRHILIAHSHGGNVALHALKDERLSSRIAGVITVGTPFLIAQKVSLGPEVMNHMIESCLRNPMRFQPPIVVVALLMVERLDHALPYSSVLGTTDSPTRIFLFLLVVAGVWAFLFLVKKQFDASVRWFNQLQVPFPGNKMLCMFAAYDEPGTCLAFLSIFRNALEIGESLLVAIGLVVAFLSGLIFLPYATSIGLTTWLIKLGIFITIVEPLQDWLLNHSKPFSFAGEILFTAIIVLVLIPVLRSLFDLLAIGSLGFGLAEWRQGWFLKQTSSIEPPSALGATVVGYDLIDIAKEFGWFRTLTGLRHSVLFKSGESLAEIQRFIAGCE